MNFPDIKRPGGPYRTEGPAGLNERVEALEKDFSGFLRQTTLNSDAVKDVKMMRTLVGGALLLVTILTVGGWSCNNRDNATKIEVSRNCPAAAPAILQEKKKGE